MNSENSTTTTDFPSTQWTALSQTLAFHGYADTSTPGLSIECLHDHSLTGTGAVFYQSTGLLQCALCRGWQLIRKPVR